MPAPAEREAPRLLLGEAATPPVARASATKAEAPTKTPTAPPRVSATVVVAFFEGDVLCGGSVGIEIVVDGAKVGVVSFGEHVVPAGELVWRMTEETCASPSERLIDATLEVSSGSARLASGARHTLECGSAPHMTCCCWDAHRP